MGGTVVSAVRRSRPRRPTPSWSGTRSRSSASRWSRTPAGRSARRATPPPPSLGARGSGRRTFNGSIPVQPEDDHTPGTGVLCFVTGNALVGDPPAPTTSTAAPPRSSPRRWRRWPGYSVARRSISTGRSRTTRAGAPGTDTWRARHLEQRQRRDLGSRSRASAPVSHADWARVLFRASRHLRVAPTSNRKSGSSPRTRAPAR